MALFRSRSGMRWSPGKHAKRVSLLIYSRVRMALAPGSRVAHYEIVAPIGAGGMGEVYRARDTELEPRGRHQGAARCLRAPTPTALARFEREAQVLAALNHPAHRRDLRHRGVDGSRCWSSSWSRAPTLADRLARGPLAARRGARRSPRRSPRRSRPRTSKGVVHRDLKPANIKVHAGRRGQGPRLRPRQGARRRRRADPRRPLAVADARRRTRLTPA